MENSLSCTIQTTSSFLRARVHLWPLSSNGSYRISLSPPLSWLSCPLPLSHFFHFSCFPFSLSFLFSLSLSPQGPFSSFFIPISLYSPFFFSFSYLHSPLFGLGPLPILCKKALKPSSCLMFFIFSPNF